MGKGYHKGPELTMANLGLSLEELNGQPLELLAREGAKMILSVVMVKEVIRISNELVSNYKN